MQCCEEISNQEAQNTAREYCLHRKLARPKTDVKKVVILLIMLELLIVSLTFGIDSLLGWLGISFAFSTLYSLVSVVVFCAVLKKLCVLSIELYQHYAPEATRRRCTLMPSCSEYAWLALHKYNIFKGLYKTYIRLTQKCKGDYEIDYP